MVDDARKLVAQRDAIMRGIAETLRHFARIEAESGRILRRSAELSRDAEAALRRGRAASDAEERRRRALQQADRITRERALPDPVHATFGSRGGGVTTDEVA